VNPSTVSQQSFFSATSTASTSSAALWGATALFAASAASVAAAKNFGKRQKDVQTSALCALPKIMEGTGGPLPGDVWDPAGLMKGKSEQEILNWRASELKHGRVAMLAVLGWFHVAGGWHFIGDAANGYERVSDNPLINLTQLPMGGLWQVLFAILCLEWLGSVPCPPPKDRPWDVLGWAPLIADEEDPYWKDRQLMELNNGRLAMVGIIGLIAQDAYTGEYFKEIAQPCFGMCKDFDIFNIETFPYIPKHIPQFYPGQARFNPSELM